MTPGEARATLRALGLADAPDFHSLSSDCVHAILDAADHWQYRQPANANGSRARYFYAFLQRKAGPCPDCGCTKPAHLADCTER